MWGETTRQADEMLGVNGKASSPQSRRGLCLIFSLNLASIFLVLLCNKAKTETQISILFFSTVIACTSDFCTTLEQADIASSDDSLTDAVPACGEPEVRLLNDGLQSKSAAIRR